MGHKWRFGIFPSFDSESRESAAVSSQLLVVHEMPLAIMKCKSLCLIIWLPTIMSKFGVLRSSWPAIWIHQEERRTEQAGGWNVGNEASGGAFIIYWPRNFTPSGPRNPRGISQLLSSDLVSKMSPRIARFRACLFYSQGHVSRGCSFIKPIFSAYIFRTCFQVYKYVGISGRCLVLYRCFVLN